MTIEVNFSSGVGLQMLVSDDSKLFGIGVFAVS